MTYKYATEPAQAPQPLPAATADGAVIGSAAPAVAPRPAVPPAPLPSTATKAAVN